MSTRKSEKEILLDQKIAAIRERELERKSRFALIEEDRQLAGGGPKSCSQQLRCTAFQTSPCSTPSTSVKQRVRNQPKASNPKTPPAAPTIPSSRITEQDVVSNVQSQNANQKSDYSPNKIKNPEDRWKPNGFVAAGQSSSSASKRTQRKADTKQAIVGREWDRNKPGPQDKRRAGPDQNGNLLITRLANDEKLVQLQTDTEPSRRHKSYKKQIDLRERLTNKPKSLSKPQSLNNNGRLEKKNNEKDNQPAIYNEPLPKSDVEQKEVPNDKVDGQDENEVVGEDGEGEWEDVSDDEHSDDIDNIQQQMIQKMTLVINEAEAALEDDEHDAELDAILDS